MDQCSLGVRERNARGRELRRIATGSLRLRSRDSSGVRLEYWPSMETEAALRELIERERECCPFLDFELSDGAGRLSLQISGSPSATAVLEAIYETSVPAAV
jgi:hypothetical protein